MNNERQCRGFADPGSIVLRKRKKKESQMRAMKKDDAIGFIGGAGCLALSELDRAWGPFWLAVGAILIAWSLISIYRGKAKL